MSRRFYNRDGLMGDGFVRFTTWDLEGLNGWEVGDGRGLISRMDEIGMVAIG